MSTIKDTIKVVTADKKVTAEEWNTTLKPQIKNTGRASADGRDLVRLYADSQYEIEPSVRKDLRKTLQDMGYPTPPVIDGSIDACRMIHGNITEPDRDFNHLIGLMGEAAAESVTVAAADAGFQIDHQAFEEKRWENAGEVKGNGQDDDGNDLVDDVHGYDFAEGDPDLKGDSHGSHVQGIETRGSPRIKCISLKAFDYSLDPREVVQCIEYAAAHGARAINMSFKLDSPDEIKLIKAAIQRHPEMLFVKSAGNDGKILDNKGPYAAETYLPCNELPNLLVVSSADADGKRASYSNYGKPYAIVAARGSDVLSAVPGGKYEYKSGTSMAAPNAAAVVAKCLVLAPKLNTGDVRKILVETSDLKPEWSDLVMSGGLINSERATRLAALIGLTVHGGMDPQAAADKLQLKGEEREKLLALLPGYPTPPIPAVDTPVDLLGNVTLDPRPSLED